jgi:hypothetical protein
MTVKKATFALFSSAVVGVLLATGVSGFAADDSTAIRGTAASSLDALSSPRGVTDRLPARAAALAFNARPAGVPEHLYPGAWETDRSRALLSGAGRLNGHVFAVPTTRGYVCYTLAITLVDPRFPNAAGGCVARLTDDEPLSVSVFDPDGFDKGEPVIVGGLMGDSVLSVDVVVNGARNSTTIGQNAFYFELANRHDYPEAAVAALSSGRTVTIRLPDPRPSLERSTG